MSEQEETVEVTLKLPKAVIDFLKSVEKNVEKYLVRTIIEDIGTCLASDKWNLANIAVKQFRLASIFKHYDISVDPYILGVYEGVVKNEQRGD